MKHIVHIGYPILNKTKKEELMFNYSSCLYNSPIYYIMILQRQQPGDSEYARLLPV